MHDWWQELLSQGPWAIGLYVFLRTLIVSSETRTKALLEGEAIRLGELRENLKACILETTRKADEALILQFRHEMGRHSRRLRAIERKMRIVDNPGPDERDEPDPEDTVP